MTKVATVVGVILAVLVVASGGAFAQSGTDGEPSSIRANVEYLASDELEGRFTGSEGIRKAADHIIAELEAMGAGPLPGVGDFRLPFEYTGSARDGGSTLRLETADGQGRDFADSVRGLSFSESTTASGPLVFAGYGLVIPETDGFSYDSYATLDVADKVVLVLRYFPEDSEGDLRALFSRYSDLRFKAAALRQRGALGMLVVTGPRSPGAGRLVRMTADAAVADSGIAALSVTGDVAEALFERVPDRTLQDAQREIDDGNPHVAGFEIPVEVTIDARVSRERRTGYNVVGYLPPTAAEPFDKPWVALGAHYDHLGRGETGSLAGLREPSPPPPPGVEGEPGVRGRGGSEAPADAAATEVGEGPSAEAGGADDIHNGADDNASGVAAVLAAGAALADRERARGVVLGFWSGEEIGLLGSQDFVNDGPLPMDEVAAYVNFDMVGRMREGALTVQGLGSSSVWPGLVDEANGGFGFDLQRVIDPYLPTDSIRFIEAEVPSLALFTGSHEDYHRPSDDAHTINFPDLERIAAYGAEVAARLVAEPAPPDFVAVQRSEQPGRAMTRITTGTIPDYGAEIEGLRLSGVMAGGPAALAGLQGGDIIVELAGVAVGNIYDYMGALDRLRADQPAAVVFMRDGERRETQLVPLARD